MAPVTILSPYSGRPVVVREQDLGRAIRDDRGRVFYVVEDPEHGRYASLTRKGSAKDLERYRGLQTGGPPATNGQADTSPSPATPSPAYDATGTKRRNPVGVAVLVVLAIAVLGGIYIALAHPEWLGLESADPPSRQGDPDAQPADPATQSAPDQGSATPQRTPSIVVPVRFVSEENADPDSYGIDLLSELGPDPVVVDDPDAKVSSAPARFPESPEAVAELLLGSGDARPAGLSDDPTPVIVPNKTWRPEEWPAVLSQTPPERKPYADFNHTASGLRYKLTHRTDGPPARAGTYLEVRYTAKSLDGKPLIDDASQSFVLMSGQAIRAFDEGLAGVREGEQISLFIPRGHSANGTLPGIQRVPDEPFLMDIQVVAVKPGVTHVIEQKGDPEATPAAPGDAVAIHYTARVEGHEQVIASTAQNGQPLRLALGKGEVIPGLELGVAGMRPGETRLLTIPPYLAYGEKGVAGGLIPPNAVLSFRITLVGIEKPDQDKPAN